MPASEEKILPEREMIQTSIAPWLTVSSADAADFYKAAFGAIEVYRLEPPDGGLVAKLTVEGATFWISAEAGDNSNTNAEPASAGAVRMILTVSDPDTLFARALNAGATVVFPVGEDHGWRLGRLVDPFGHHWEIGRPLGA